MLVIDAMANTVSRWHSDGTPSNFAALGGNVIDGVGPGADHTPQNGLAFGEATEVQVAVAPSGSAGGTAGNIYVAQAGSALIDIFSAAGAYIGQLTAAGSVAFGEPCGVTVDATGSVYVGDFSNNKVHKFSPSANPPSNADHVSGFDGTVEGPCTLAAGIGPSGGAVFVAGWNTLSGLIPQPDRPVTKLDGVTGEIMFEIAGRPTTVTVDPSTGDLLLAEHRRSANESIVKEYDASGASVSEPIWQERFEASTIEGIAADGPLYLARSNASTILEFSPLQLLPPRIDAIWSSDVELTAATLNGRFGPREEDATYHFEYLSDAAYTANGESFVGPHAPTSAPVPDAIAGSARTVSVEVSGLQPGTKYRYRLVAENPAGVTESPAQSFSTFASDPPETACSNQALRTGDAAFLPDCRAYEMVSPVEKNGANIISGLSDFRNPGGNIRASRDGERIAYSALFASFAGAPDSFKFNQYLAERGASGWTTRGISPPVSGRQVDTTVFGFFREFIAFSPDLCSAWKLDLQTPAPTADGQQGYRNLYRLDNCEPGAGGLEALTPSPPALPEGTPGAYVTPDSVQGVSDDVSQVAFIAKAKLTGQAAEGTHSQVYNRSSGANHIASVLPSGLPSPNDSAVGSGWSRNLDNAVSADGSRVYWVTAVDADVFGQGQIYVRLNPGQPESDAEDSEGNCLPQPARACTLRVSVGAPARAFFWTAADDGSKALYSEENLVPGTGSKLFEFDLEAAEAGDPPRRLIADRVSGVAGASDDLSRIYFASREVLAGAGPNSEGDEAVAGQPNLYVDEGGKATFVATLLDSEASGSVENRYSPVTNDPWERASRVSADGSRLVFMSRARLTDYDNADAASGESVLEVFAYEAGGDLLCVSCNPSGARPASRTFMMPYSHPWENEAETDVRAAAWIPTWEHPLYDSNVVSADGTRLFFNANDPLLPRDRNGAQDVYEWEAAGTGGCEEGDPHYFEQNGGCVYLISSGTSSFESEFWDASPDGRDVFFTTAASLVSEDPGLVDLYDARVGGGFARPPKAVACEGEACQSPPAPPRFPTPASGSFQGPGNLSQGRDCRRPAKRAAQLSRRAKRLRGAAGRADQDALSRRLRGRARRTAAAARKQSRSAKRCRRANRRVGR